MAALDRPRRGPSRPRDAGKGQDRLWAWHAETGHDPAVSYFAMSGTANYTPAAVLISPTPRRSRAFVTALERPHRGPTMPRPSSCKTGSGRGVLKPSRTWQQVTLQCTARRTANSWHCAARLAKKRRGQPPQLVGRQQRTPTVDEGVHGVARPLPAAVHRGQVRQQLSLPPSPLSPTRHG